MDEEEWRRQTRDMLTELRMNRPELFRWLRNEVDRLAREYVIGDETMMTARERTFYSRVTMEQAERMAWICNARYVFCNNIEAEDMLWLLRCRPKSDVRINRLRLFAGMFVQLQSRGLVSDNWQMFLYKSGRIFTHSGERISQSNISSSVYYVMRTHNEDLDAIIKKIKEIWQTTDV